MFLVIPSLVPSPLTLMNKEFDTLRLLFHCLQSPQNFSFHKDDILVKNYGRKAYGRMMLRIRLRPADEMKGRVALALDWAMGRSTLIPEESFWTKESTG